MKICITRSNAQAYSETFIAQQITSLQSIFGEEHVIRFMKDGSLNVTHRVGYSIRCLCSC